MTRLSFSKSPKKENDSKSGGTRSKSRKSTSQDAEDVESKVRERINRSFRLKEKGRIKEILTKKFNLFQKGDRSSSRSKSKSSEQ